MNLRFLYDPDEVYKTSFLERSLWNAWESELSPQSDAAGFDAFKREMFVRLYSWNPPKLEIPTNPGMDKIHAQIAQLDELEALKASVAGKSMLSAAATEAFAESVIKMLGIAESPTEQERKDARTEQYFDPDGHVSTEYRDNYDAKLAQFITNLDSDEVRAVLRKALMEATSSANSILDVCFTFGWGAEIGQHPSRQEGDTARKLLERAQHDPKFAKLLDAIGKIRGLSDYAIRIKPSMVGSERTDTELGNDLARTVPSEFVWMELCPELFGKKYIEHQLLQYALKPPSGKKRGDALILLDVSGSMAGYKNELSKGITVAMAKILERQKRKVCVMRFDKNIIGSPVIAPLSPDGINEILSWGAGGGTNFDNAIIQSMRLIPSTLTLSNADLVFVTDGYCRFATAEATATIRAHFGRLFGIVVPPGSARGLAVEGVDVFTSYLSDSVDNDKSSLVDVFQKL